MAILTCSFLPRLDFSSHFLSRSRLHGVNASLANVSLIGIACLAVIACAVSGSAEDHAAGAPQENAITAEDRDHWSFRPLAAPAIPVSVNREWIKNPIDAFILRRLENAGLHPMPAADRRTLIRRVTYDLTGLPPTPEAIAEFENDARPDAWERLIDRLLASDHYGEHWGQHWLDLARFAETDGFEHDKIRAHAWRYRDWVIHAWNEDMPFDQFVQWQLAGDEIAPQNASAHIATGFLLCGPDMPDINLQDERRHNVLNEMTSTTGAVFLGLQFECAQCHDHKFDPISQADFYRLRAFFDSSEFFRESALPTPEWERRRQDFEQQRANRWKALESQIADLQKSLDDNSTAAKDEKKQQLKQLQTELERVKKQRGPQPPLARKLVETRTDPVESYLRERGDFRRKGHLVRAAFPRIANPAGRQVVRSERQSSTGQRTQLAQWITQPDHPLTSRVIVNRLWMHHFGRGLSESPSDFGIMGNEPTHPELLDWLARELPRRDWSIKSIHRLILTTATYQQISHPSSAGGIAIDADRLTERFAISLEEDPENRLFSRMPRRRLSAESIRDSMLYVSKLLSQRRGGQGVRPPLPPELVSTLLKNQWPVSPNPLDHDRRSIYLFVRRNLRYPLFGVFDKPDTNASCARRDQSIIAPQALMLLNSQQSLRAAAGIAHWVLLHHPDLPSRIRFGFETTFGRVPRPSEQEICRSAYQELLESIVDDAEDREQWTRLLPSHIDWPDSVKTEEIDAMTMLCLTWFNTNEFLFVD